MIIYNNYFLVSVDRQTFLGFQMTPNSRDSSPLNQLKAEGRLIFYAEVLWLVRRIAWHDETKIILRRSLKVDKTMLILARYNALFNVGNNVL